MNPIIVIAINADNAVRAEATLDWIYQLANREQKEHIAIIFDDDCSPEQKDKIRITAELAFSTVREFAVPRSKSEIERRNAAFLEAAAQCQRSIKGPWLWLESDCTPTNPNWLQAIGAAYDNQPARYLGVHLRPSQESAERFLFRVGVYHMGCFNDIGKACADKPTVPFEVTSGPHLVPRSSKCRLFQPLKIEDESDFDKIWPEAQIVCGDTSGALIQHFREAGIHIRMPKKIDGRTKAGRALNKPPEAAKE